MSDDNIINFPGVRANPNREHQDPDRLSPSGEGILGVPGLTRDQEKAIGLVLSGMPFVCIGISPTATGADFFVAADGKRRDLVNARPHLGRILDEHLEHRGV